MNNEELSLESLYANGLGWSNKTDTIKEEPFDGEMDHISMELASAENLVEFTDMYSKLESKNASDKINMIKKLNIRYGRGGSKAANSIESFLYTQSIEAEAESNAAEGNPVTEKKYKDVIDTEKINNKALKFLATAFNAIVNFFRKIFDKILSAIRWLINAIKGLFTKDDSNLSKIDELPEDEISALDAAIAKSEFEYETKDDSKMIPISGHPAKHILDFVNSTYAPIMEKIVQLTEHLNFEDNEINSRIFDEFNNIIKYFSTLPGIGTTPTLNGTDEASLNSYNKQINAIGERLDFEKFAESYSKLIAGATILKPKRVVDLTGTNKIKEIKKLLKEENSNLDELKLTLKKVNDRFNNASSTFNETLDAIKGRVGATSNNVPESNLDNKNNNTDDKVIVIGCKLVESTFKLAAKLLSIVTNVQSSITTSVGKVARTINNLPFFKRKFGIGKLGKRGEARADKHADKKNIAEENKIKKDAESAAKKKQSDQDKKEAKEYNQYRNYHNKAKLFGSKAGPAPEVSDKVIKKYYEDVDNGNVSMHKHGRLEWNPDISIEEFYNI